MGTDIKRLRYFNGQFLREPDFTAEQEYHKEMRRRHNSLLHTWGIAKGLALGFNSGASVVTVSEGSAVDVQGREMVLANDGDTPDLAGFKNKSVYITIAYGEKDTDPTSEGGVSGNVNTRWTEKPVIEISENAPASGDIGVKLLLGRATVNNAGQVTGIDDGIEPNKRRAAGVVGGDLQVTSLVLSAQNIAPSLWTRLSLGAEGRTDMQGNLKVGGSVELGADLTITGMLHGVNLVGTAQLADNSVTAAKIQDGSVGAAELSNNAVTSAKLQADAAVDANRAVTTNHIRDNAVTGAKIADGTVGTVELANNAVTSAKLQADASVDANRAVTTDHLRDNAVTLNKLATAARPPSIDGVSNPGGNIELLNAGAITITPDNANKRITIGESHSALTTNPHGTTAAQVQALALTGGALTGNLQVNGSLGIGTAPADTLDVNGDVRVRGADIKDAGGTARVTLADGGNLDLKRETGAVALTVDVDGKIGIGANSNLSKLTVKGNYVYITGTVATTAGSNIVTGTGTSFLTKVVIGDWVWVAPPGGGSAESKYVTAIASDTSLTVDAAFTLSVSGFSFMVVPSLFRAESAWSDEFFVSPKGHVGIGTRDTGGDLLDVRGRCYSSGGWQTTNADYAEYFESANGESIPVATPVVLADGGKIRVAKKGEVPFGIATENSAIVGNSYKEWPQKYLRDKYGRVIMEKVKEEIKIPKRIKIKKERQQVKQETVTEEVSRPEIVLEGGKYVRKENVEKVTRVFETPQFREVELFDSTGKNVIGKHKVPLMESYEEEVDELDEKGEPVLVGAGEMVAVERPKLNPKHDEIKKYLTREERPEWICVGLLGQLPLRKGKPVAPTWLKIKDLDDDVELWLVK